MFIHDVNEPQKKPVKKIKLAGSKICYDNVN